MPKQLAALVDNLEEQLAEIQEQCSKNAADNVLQILALECAVNRISNDKSISEDRKHHLEHRVSLFSFAKMYASLADADLPTGKEWFIIRKFCTGIKPDARKSILNYAKWIEKTNRSISLFHSRRPDEFEIFDRSLKGVHDRIGRINGNNFTDYDNEILSLHAELKSLFYQILRLIENPRVKVKYLELLWELLKETAIGLSDSLELSHTVRQRCVLDSLVQSDVFVGRFKFLDIYGFYTDFYDKAFLTPERHQAPIKLADIPGFDIGCSIELIGNQNNPTYVLTSLPSPVDNTIEKKCIFRQRSQDLENAIAISLLQKHGLGAFLVDVFYKKKSPIKGDDGYMEVVEYLQEGNLQDILDKSEDYSSRSHQRLTLLYLLQLCEMMDRFAKAGVLFPDLKPTNLMVKHGQFVLSDFKSLIPFNLETNLAPTSVMSTKIYLPPEQAKRQFGEHDSAKIKVDAYHSYQVGLTMYLFAVGLKGKEGPYKIKPDNHTGQRTFDFNHPVFHGSRGRCLKEAIEGLTHHDEKHRMKLVEAMKILAVAAPKKPVYRTMPTADELLAGSSSGYSPR